MGKGGNSEPGHAILACSSGACTLLGEWVWECTGVRATEGLFDRKGVVSVVSHRPGHCTGRKTEFSGVGGEHGGISGSDQGTPTWEMWARLNSFALSSLALTKPRVRVHEWLGLATVAIYEYWSRGCATSGCAAAPAKTRKHQMGGQTL